MLKSCKRCDATIVLGSGVVDGEDTFCSAGCRDFYRRGQQGFCKECLEATTDEAPGGMWLVRFGGGRYGVDWGFFGTQRCPRCNSVVKRRWINLLIPLIPIGKYRVIELSHRDGLTGESGEFLARKLR